MDFDGSAAQKAQVIQYIQDRVKKDYCEELDACQETTLRMMEKQNLKAFKEATQAKDRKIMDNVIKTYCTELDACSYTTINMMYKQNAKAAKEALEW